MGPIPNRVRDGADPQRGNSVPVQVSNPLRCADDRDGRQATSGFGGGKEDR